MERLILTCVAVMLLVPLVVLPAVAENTTDYAKVYLIPLTVQSSGVSSGTVILMYGHGPALGLQAGPFRAEFTDEKGTVKKNFAVRDPRIRFGDSAWVSADGRVSAVTGVYEKSESADLTLIVPFSNKYTRFRVYDEQGSPVTTIDLVPVLDRFCALHPGDPDCNGGNAPLPPVLIGGAVLVLLLAVVAGWYLLKKGTQPGER